MTNFRPLDRKTGFLMPPSIDEWPSAKASGAVRGRGHRRPGPGRDEQELPRLGVSLLPSGGAADLLVYGCATDVFSSRKLERATYDSVAFRFIAANDHPDHHLPGGAFSKRSRPGEATPDGFGSIPR